MELKKGVDMITKSDESFKIGDSTVSMQEILDKIRINRGDIVEKDLKSKQNGFHEQFQNHLEYTLFSPVTISGIYILIS